MKRLPNFRYEKKLWKKDYTFVVGADEVGRGALAGPIVAGAVVFSNEAMKQLSNEGVVINDSKKLSPRKREKASEWIKTNALAWGVGEASVATINRLGIAKATKMAFRKAIAECNSRLQTTVYGLQRKKAVVGLPAEALAKGGSPKAVDFLLVDAFYVPYVRGLRRKNQLAIIDGDEKSISIAAASIIAKVYRDKLMVKLSRKYKKYGWEKNKGYGTREHQEAIKKWGITRLHRRKFVGRLLQSLTI